MIKAEELRIGNFVNVPRLDQSPFRIDAFEYLGKDFGKVAQNNGEYEVPGIGEVPFHPLTWELKDLSPIPLSPEILEKCGFTKYDKGNSDYEIYTLSNGIYISMAKIDIPYGFNAKAGCWYIGDVHTEIKSLHWLQNYIYFNYNGFELTINL